MKRTRIFFSVTAVFALLLAMGCSTIDGEVSANQAPSVSFVNNQQDADSVTTIYEIDDYSFIFPDSLQGFEEDENQNMPGEANLLARYELIRYQYFFIEGITQIVEIDPETGAESVVPAEAYQIDPDVARYLWIQHTDDFAWELGKLYRISGSFRYTPVFSYAPMIFWRGSDADGFVESYRYYDFACDEEDCEVAEFIQRVEQNDPTIQWTETVNTQTSINLTTSLGRIQRHVVFVQAIDNDGAVSSAAMRTFNRSNRAPNSPKIAYYKDGYSQVSQPGEYQRHIIGYEDIFTDPSVVNQLRTNVSPYYEIPINEDPLINWSGLRFLVSGDDPDDQALVTIPLEFQYLLHRIPDSLVDEWMAADAEDTDLGTQVMEMDSVRVTLSEDNVVDFEGQEFNEDYWSSFNQIELYNLPTGFYQLTVWSRDDGLERCAEPAWMRFKVQEVTMERDLLVMNLTPPGASNLGFESDQDHRAYYLDMLEELMPQVKATVGEDAAYEVRWMHDSPEDYNCRYWWIESNQDDMDDPYTYLLPFSVISQYRTVIVIDDKWAQGSGAGTSYTQVRLTWKAFAMDYLDMGGSMLWTGYSSLRGTFNYSNGEDTGAFLADKAGDFLERYMGVSSVYGDDNTTFFFGRLDGCLAADPIYEGTPGMVMNKAMVDSLRLTTGYNSFYEPSAPFPYRWNPPDSAAVFVEAFAINEGLGTIATHTFDSYSTGLDEETTFDFYRVARASDLPAIFYTTDDVNYPGQDPWFPAYSPEASATGCWLFIPTVAQNYWGAEILAAFDAHNASRPDSMWALPREVVSLTVAGRQKTYIHVEHQRINDPAEYWAAGDTVLVDVEWQPILEKHRKPVSCYTESLAYEGSFMGQGLNPYYTNFRTAFNAMPLHMVHRGEAPNFAAYDYGSGAIGYLGGVLLQFYMPKVQDYVEE